MRKSIVLIYTVLAFSLLLSCTKESEESPAEDKNLFTFKVSESYITKNDTSIDDKAWVLIYSLDKTLLFEQELKNGQTYNCNLQNDEPVNVHLMTARFSQDNYNRNYYDILVYTKVLPDTWVLGPELSMEDEPEPLGITNVVLKDIRITDYNYSLLKSSSAEGNYLSSTNNTFKIPLYYNPDAVWLNLQSINGSPLYKWIEGVTLDETLTIWKKDLILMNNVDVEYPANEYAYIYVEGIDLSSHDDIYSECYHSYDIGSQTTVKAYYPSDVFSDFWVYYYARSENISNYYIQTAVVIPLKFEILDANVGILQNSVESFHALFNGSFDYYCSVWHYFAKNSYENHRFTYSIYGSAEDAINYYAPDIPTSIVSLDEEMIDLKQLGYSYTKIVEDNYMDGYSDFIEIYRDEPEKIQIQGASQKCKYIYNPNAKKELLFPEKTK